MGDYKIIQDPVHGAIKVDDILLPLLSTPEVERLRHIKQLGLAFLVFPGANHNRLEHSIGTANVARAIADAVGLDDYERRLVSAAALLHDIGHGPFSHVIEMYVHNILGMDHMDITKKIITGDFDPIPEGERENLQGTERICDILERYDLDPKDVAELIDEKNPVPQNDRTLLEFQGNQAFFSPGKRYLKQIIHGTVDADQIDYLLRDAYYTGVAYGIIDYDRIMKTLTLYHNEVVIEKSGVPAIEGLLVARTLMYTSVYYHKTTRIAEQMLSRALELATEGIEDLPILTDGELMKRLYDLGGIQRRIITRIKYRQLYKAALILYADDLNDELRERLLDLSNHDTKRDTERALAIKLGLEDGEVIIDVPNRSLLLSEPRIKKTAFKILDSDGTLGNLNTYSPLARALQMRQIPDWVLCISGPENHRDELRRLAERYIL